MGKKELIIIGAIAVALIAFLVFRNSGQVNYSFPELQEMESSEINTITYTKADQKVLIKREDGIWVMEGPGYKADPLKIGSILGKALNPVFLEQVSFQESYSAYGLKEEDAVLIHFEGPDGIFSYFIGSTAGKRGTYVRLKGHRGVFTVKGDLTSLFPENYSDLRDKMVLSFQSENLTQVRLKKGEEVIALTWSDDQKSWLKEGSVFEDSDDLSRQLKTLGQLKCTEYLESSLDGTPLLTIDILGDSQDSILVYNKVEYGYEATSSQSDYSFLMSAYLVDDLLDFFK